MRLLNPGWQTIDIGGKAADVFEPRYPRIPTQAVLFLHGHGLQTLIGNEMPEVGTLNAGGRAATSKSTDPSTR